MIASAAFAVYVANFASYDKTYGTMAGVIVLLLWLWITNLADPAQPPADKVYWTRSNAWPGLVPETAHAGSGASGRQILIGDFPPEDGALGDGPADRFVDEVVARCG